MLSPTFSEYCKNDVAVLFSLSYAAALLLSLSSVVQIFFLLVAVAVALVLFATAIAALSPEVRRRRSTFLRRKVQADRAIAERQDQLRLLLARRLAEAG